tara:strand:- start:337 stop:441 length:105 start_codon:yes stop_codon:yes gene_type:complete
MSWSRIFAHPPVKVGDWDIGSGYAKKRFMDSEEN